MKVGKIAFVTGAGSGIGRATCQILAREGVDIIASDINLEPCQKTIDDIQHNVKKLAIRLDVSDKHDVKEALKKSIETFGTPPTIIVNCAGIFATRDRYTCGLVDDEYQKIMDVNLKGSANVLAVFSKALIEAKITEASIINTGSIVTKMCVPGWFSYTASKAGVETLTVIASKELGQFGIRVNAVQPGCIDTAMIQNSYVPDEMIQSLVDQSPLRRRGKPEEIGEVIAFLASSRSSFMTGSIVKVDGGMQ